MDGWKGGPSLSQRLWSTSLRENLCSPCQCGLLSPHTLALPMHALPSFPLSNNYSPFLYLGRCHFANYTFPVDSWWFIVISEEHFPFYYYVIVVFEAAFIYGWLWEFLVCRGPSGCFQPFTVASVNHSLPILSKTYKDVALLVATVFLD